LLLLLGLVLLSALGWWLAYSSKLANTCSPVGQRKGWLLHPHPCRDNAWGTLLVHEWRLERGSKRNGLSSGEILLQSKGL
jgi:hypothetical protein